MELKNAQRLHLHFQLIQKWSTENNYYVSTKTLESLSIQKHIENNFTEAEIKGYLDSTKKKLFEAQTKVRNKQAELRSLTLRSTPGKNNGKQEKKLEEEIKTLSTTVDNLQGDQKVFTAIIAKLIEYEIVRKRLLKERT
jgi:hypothetical protein